MKKKILISIAVGFLGIVCLCGVLLYNAAAPFALHASLCDTPIHTLVKYSGGMSKAKFVDYIKQRKLDVNEPCGENSITPMHFAAEYNPTVIPYLVELGGKINGQDADGNTPLHYAVGSVHMEDIKTLLKCGANPLIKNKGGVSALDICKENCKRYSDYPPQKCKMMEAHLTKR